LSIRAYDRREEGIQDLLRVCVVPPSWGGEDLSQQQSIGVQFSWKAQKREKRRLQEQPKAYLLGRLVLITTD